MTALLEAQGLSKFFPARDGKGLVRESTRRKEQTV